MVMKNEKKENGKVKIFAGIVLIVLLVGVFGFIFRKPLPEIIQGEAEANEVRISGKVPGRIALFLVDEGDRVRKGDTVAILDSPEVIAKYSQARAAEEAAQALSDKAQKGAREEKITMAYQTWKRLRQPRMLPKNLMNACRNCSRTGLCQLRKEMRPKRIIKRCQLRSKPPKPNMKWL